MAPDTASILTGLTTPDPHDPDTVLFDPSHEGGLSVRIPRALIETMSPLTGAGGRDGATPASVVLKAPTTPEAAAYAAMAHAYAELLAVTRQAIRGGDEASRGAAVVRLQTEAAFETEEAAPWSDGPCQSECDRKYPDNWRQRWVCKLFCP